MEPICSTSHKKVNSLCETKKQLGRWQCHNFNLKSFPSKRGMQDEGGAVDACNGEPKDESE